MGAGTRDAFHLDPMVSGHGSSTVQLISTLTPRGMLETTQLLVTSDTYFPVRRRHESRDFDVTWLVLGRIQFRWTKLTSAKCSSGNYSHQKVAGC